MKFTSMFFTASAGYLSGDAKIQTNCKLAYKESFFANLQFSQVLSKLFILYIMFFSVAVGSFTHYPVKGSIERLTIGKAYRRAYLFYCLIEISFVDHSVKCLLNAILVEQTREIHIESGIYHSRNVTGICV